MTRAPAGRKPAVPKADPDWHPNARRFYAGLRKSGQATYYEASDWALAWHIAAMMSHNLEDPGASNAAALLGQILKGADQLLASEGARRRMRLELQRQGTGEGSGEDDAAVAAMEDYREKLRGA